MLSFLRYSILALIFCIHTFKTILRRFSSITLLGETHNNGDTYTGWSSSIPSSRGWLRQLVGYNDTYLCVVYFSLVDVVCRHIEGPHARFWSSGAIGKIIVGTTEIERQNI